MPVALYFAFVYAPEEKIMGVVQRIFYFHVASAWTGLLSFFDGRIFSASMVKNGKPAPDLFLHAARTMGFPPENCVVVEDSPAGIRAAHSAGMQVFAFTGGSHAEVSNLTETVRELKPTAIFDDMAGLASLIEAVRT